MAGAQGGYGGNLNNNYNARNNAMASMQQLDSAIMGRLMFRNMPAGGGGLPFQPPPLPLPLPHRNSGFKPMHQPINANFNPSPAPMGMNHMKGSGFVGGSGYYSNNNTGNFGGMPLQNNMMGMGQMNINQGGGNLMNRNGGMGYGNQPPYSYGQPGGNMGYQGQPGQFGGNMGMRGPTGPMPDNPALRNMFNRENNL